MRTHPTTREKAYVVTVYICDYNTYISPWVDCITKNKEIALAKARNMNIDDLLREQGMLNYDEYGTVKESVDGMCFTHEYGDRDLLVEIKVHEEYWS